MLARLPPPAAAPVPFERRARRVPLGQAQHTDTVDTAATFVAPAATVLEQVEDYEGDCDDEEEVALDRPQGQPPRYAPGRPHGYNRNGRAAPPPQVRDHDHLPKLKLNIPTFEGRYVPDIYLTWELETEQRFTCLQFPEDRRVAAAVCSFTSFACVWWSEHCRIHPNNIPTTASKFAW